MRLGRGRKRDIITEILHAPGPPMSMSMLMELFVVAVAEGIVLLMLVIAEAMVIVPIVLMAAALDCISIALRKNLRSRSNWPQKVDVETTA